MQFAASARRFCWCTIILGAGGLLPSTVSAQFVQLPTTQQTSVSTMVEVPTGGSTYLGGIGRAGGATAARQASHFGSRQTGIYSSGSGNGVTTTVIDLKMLDEAILNQKLEPGIASTPGKSGLPLAGRNHAATNYRKISSIPGAYMQALAGDPALNPSSVPKVDTSAEIRELLEKAQRARQMGRHAAAEVYYRMIIERLPPDVVKRLETEVRTPKK
jgi:hypothetical protein